MVGGEEIGGQLMVLDWLFGSIMLGWFVLIKYFDTFYYVILCFLVSIGRVNI